MSQAYQPSDLEQLQLDIVALLESLAGFTYITVTPLRPRVDGAGVLIQTDIDDQLKGLTPKNGKGGLSVIVGMPEGDVDYPEAPGPEFILVVPIRIFENPLINMGTTGTLISADSAALMTANACHKFNFGITGAELYCPKDCVRPLVEYAAQDMVAYEVRIATRLRLAAPDRVKQPVFGGDSSGFTISCATPGATITFTTDGSFPGPSATAYPGSAITGIAAGTLVRAAAYAINQSGSPIASLTLT